MKKEQKCPHETDYTHVDMTFENESHVVEEVECIDCGARGYRDFHLTKEQWYVGDKMVTENIINQK